MNSRAVRRQSHLFTVRLWKEELGDGQFEWRGETRHVISGARYFFRDWAKLIESLVARLEELEDETNITKSG